MKMKVQWVPTSQATKLYLPQNDYLFNANKPNAKTEELEQTWLEKSLERMYNIPERLQLRERYRTTK